MIGLRWRGHQIIDDAVAIIIDLVASLRLWFVGRRQAERLTIILRTADDAWTSTGPDPHPTGHAQAGKYLVSEPVTIVVAPIAQLGPRAAQLATDLQPCFACHSARAALASESTVAGNDHRWGVLVNIAIAVIVQIVTALGRRGRHPVASKGPTAAYMNPQSAFSGLLGIA